MSIPDPLGRGVRRFVSSTRDLPRPSEMEDGEVFGVSDGARIHWYGEKPVTFVVGGEVRAHLETGGNSRPEILCRDQSWLDLTTKVASAPRVSTQGRSQVRCRAKGDSRPRISATAFSILTVIASDSSRPEVSATDVAAYRILVYDSAQPRADDWPEKWRARVSDLYFGQRLTCFRTEDEAVEAAKSLYSQWLQCRNRHLASMRVVGAVPKLCPDVVDFRWQQGTVHLELPSEVNPRAWFSTDAHHEKPLTEERRGACTRRFLSDES